MIAGWPPPWSPDAAPITGGDWARAPTHRAAYPPAGWPSKEQADYTTKLITAGLLVLALPWLVIKLLTDPGAVFAGAARQHLKP
jgi:hypothetical protein